MFAVFWAVLSLVLGPESQHYWGIIHPQRFPSGSRWGDLVPISASLDTSGFTWRGPCPLDSRPTVRAQNTANLLSIFFDFLVFQYMLGFFGGLNHSRMVNVDFRTYCNIVCIIFGNSKNVTKHRPSDPLFITKIYLK